MSSAPRSGDAERERRLCLALRPDRPDLAQLAAGTAEDIDLVDCAARHGVDALLAARLTEAGLLDGLDPAARTRLRERVLERQRERLAYDEATIAALDCLNEASVPALLLKGAALGATHYRSAVERPMHDVDVLVPPADCERAVAALEAAGFGVPAVENRDFWSAAYFHLPLRAPGAARVLVELHWSIAQRDRHALDVEGLIAAGRRIRVGPAPALVLSPYDMLLHLSLHHAYHYFQPRLIWVYDRALAHTEAASAEPLLARARAWRARIPLALALLQTEKVFPGLLPPELGRIARASRRARWLVRAFGSDEPIALFSGWSRRRRQLLLGMLMLDRPSQAVRALAGWSARARRFGDRAGHRREFSETDGTNA